MWKSTTRSVNAIASEDEDPSIEPALELERRLYESAVAGLDQEFAKEEIVGTFLTSGAIVAFVYSVQSLAQLAPLVGQIGLLHPASC